MTTIETLTDEQITQLRDEARIAGDDAMVAVCDRALEGSGSDRRVCAYVIQDAEAQS